MGIARYDHTVSGWQFSYYINSTGSSQHRLHRRQRRQRDAHGQLRFGQSAPRSDRFDQGRRRATTHRPHCQRPGAALRRDRLRHQPPSPFRANSLIEVTDTGANAGFTTLATDTGKSTFTGVAFSPFQSVSDTFDVSAVESFDGSNSPTLGSDWVGQAGRIAVQNNDAVAMGDLDVDTVNGFSATDVIVSADVDIHNAGSAGGLVARYAGPGDQNMYWAGVQNINNASVALVGVNVGGVWTGLSQTAVFLNTSTPLPLAGTLRFEVVGSTLKLFMNRTLVTVVDDVSLSGPGLVGIRSNAGAIFNNFFAVQHAVPASTPTTFTDNFGTSNYDSASNTTSASGGELGLNWSEQVGGYALASGAVNSTTALDVATLRGVSTADVEATADITLATNGAAGLVARYAGPGDRNMYWGAILNVNGKNFGYIFRNVAGTWSVLNFSDTVIGTGAAIPSAGSLRFEVFGSSLKLFLNGNLVAVAHDSVLTAPGSVGMRSNVGATMDNFGVVPHAAATAGSAPFNENFGSRYNGATNVQDSSGAELPLDWTERIGAFATSAGAATSSALLDLATVNGLTATNPTITINATIANVGQTIGAVARYSGPDDTNMYYGRVIKTGTSTVLLEIWKNLGGVWTKLTSQDGVTYAGSFQFVLSGTTLHMLVGGTDLSFTDTSSPITTAGAFGVRATPGTTMTSFGVS